MDQKLLKTCLVLLISSHVWAHDLSYKACPPKSVGCFVGRYSLGAGLGWSRFRSRTSFWPHLKAEMGATNHVAIELSLGGINSQELYHSLSTAPSFVLGAGLEYYPRELYRGFLVRTLLLKHLYREDLSNQRYNAETALLSTVGWRWRSEDHPGGFVLAAGAQKLLNGGGALQPVIETQVAFDFNLDSIFY